MPHFNSEHFIKANTLFYIGIYQKESQNSEIIATQIGEQLLKMVKLLHSK